MALITPEQARELIPAISGDEADVRLTGLIQVADNVFAKYLGWPEADSGAFTLEETARTEYVDRPTATDPLEVRLAVRPVVSVESVAEDTANDRTYATAVDAATYSVFDVQRALVYRAAGWRWQRRGTRIRYTAGFTAETLPADLAFCFRRMVRHLWDAPAFADFTQDVNTQYRPFRAPIAIPAEITPFLEPFRRSEAIVG